MRTNEKIQKLCQKITVIEDKKMTEKTPNLRPALVRVFMADGTTFEAHVSTNRGDWQDPYSEDELKQKFLSLTKRLWSEKKALNVHSYSQNLEKIPLDDFIKCIMN